MSSVPTALKNTQKWVMVLDRTGTKNAKSRYRKYFSLGNSIPVFGIICSSLLKAIGVTEVVLAVNYQPEVNFEAFILFLLFII
ncbi:hypothetical protein Hanom_Chr17g01544701 [Helianthus anomalus]